jgi:pimeloyl-ACP methyl ester carboxylesterase
MICAFNGGSIDYNIYGQGNCLVLLHGFLEDDSIWNDLIKFLEPTYKVICINLPGNSKSLMPGDIYSMNLMADCVNEILKQQNISAATIIGHSMGGYVSLAFADRYNEKCKGVVLINSTAYADSDEKKRDRERAIKVIQTNKSVFINEAIPNLFAPDNISKFKNEINTLKETALQMPDNGITACLRGMKERKDYSRYFIQQQLPLLFVAGKYDNIIPFEKSIAQKNITAQTYFVEMQKSGHMCFIEEKEKLCHELAGFLNQIHH